MKCFIKCWQIGQLLMKGAVRTLFIYCLVQSLFVSAAIPENNKILLSLRAQILTYLCCAAQSPSGQCRLLP